MLGWLFPELRSPSRPSRESDSLRFLRGLASEEPTPRITEDCSSYRLGFKFIFRQVEVEIKYDVIRRRWDRFVVWDTGLKSPSQIFTDIYVGCPGDAIVFLLDTFGLRTKWLAAVKAWEEKEAAMKRHKEELIKRYSEA